jgi:hypothetical protein
MNKKYFFENLPLCLFIKYSCSLKHIGYVISFTSASWLTLIQGCGRIGGGVSSGFIEGGIGSGCIGRVGGGSRGVSSRGVSSKSIISSKGNSRSIFHSWHFLKEVA